MKKIKMIYAANASSSKNIESLLYEKIITYKITFDAVEILEKGFTDLPLIELTDGTLWTEDELIEHIDEIEPLEIIKEE